MEKFTHDEISLIDHLINLILKKDKKYKLYDEHFFVEKPFGGPYRTERIFKQIRYDKTTDFCLFFDKWYIDEKPTLKSKIKNYFGDNKNQSIHAVYPGTGQLRISFQKGENRGWSINSYEKWNKQLIVKGFTISDTEGEEGGELYFHNSKSHNKLYIQTNDINIAKEKINKFFYKLLIDAMEREINKKL
mgnify:FL=1